MDGHEQNSCRRGPLQPAIHIIHPLFCAIRSISTLHIIDTVITQAADSYIILQWMQILLVRSVDSSSPIEHKVTFRDFTPSFVLILMVAAVSYYDARRALTIHQRAVEII